MEQELVKQKRDLSCPDFLNWQLNVKREHFYLIKEAKLNRESNLRKITKLREEIKSLLVENKKLLNKQEEMTQEKYIAYVERLIEENKDSERWNFKAPKDYFNIKKIEDGDKYGTKKI